LWVPDRTHPFLPYDLERTCICKNHKVYCVRYFDILIATRIVLTVFQVF
jgi:hypothetical protein